MGLERGPGRSPQEQDSRRLQQLWERESGILAGIEQARRWRIVQSVLIPVTLLVLGCVAPLVTVDDNGPSFGLLDVFGLALGGDLDRGLGLADSQTGFAGWVVVLLFLMVVATFVASFHLATAPNAAWTAVGYAAPIALLFLLLLHSSAVVGNVDLRDDGASALTSGALCLALGAVWLIAGTAVRRGDR